MHRQSSRAKDAEVSQSVSSVAENRVRKDELPGKTREGHRMGLDLLRATGYVNSDQDIPQWDPSAMRLLGFTWKTTRESILEAIEKRCGRGTLFVWKGWTLATTEAEASRGK